MKPTKLPLLPSALIRVALEDLAKCEAQPDKFKVEMNWWYKPPCNEGDVCHVCMAGAVIANRFLDDVRPSVILNRYEVIPGLNDLPETSITDLKALIALNDFRVGGLAAGLSRLGIEKPADFPHFIGITDYGIDPVAFRAELGALATMLEGVGL
jgi:hypothetical protein